LPLNAPLAGVVQSGARRFVPEASNSSASLPVYLWIKLWIKLKTGKIQAR